MAVDPKDAKRIHEMDQAIAGAVDTARGAVAFFRSVLDSFNDQPVALAPPRRERMLIALELTKSWLMSLMAAAVHIRKEGKE